MNTGNIILLLSLTTGFFSLILLYVQKKKISTTLLYFSIFLLFTAFIVLIYYFLTDNFSNVYVHNHSSKNLSYIYKLSAVWAGQQGSLLLWLTIFALLLFFYIKKNISTSILIIYLYMLLTVVISSPFFFYHDTPLDGKGIDPVLKNIWMTIHPPLLFLGYSFTIFPLALIFATSRPAELIKKARPWIIGAAFFMGMGIFTGSYWAYNVPGWGGFWNWDPVENSTLVPWILTIILLHSVFIQIKYKSHTMLNIVLIILTLSTVISGTYLTRSGLVNDFSAHSFIKSPISDLLLIAIILVLFVPAAYIFWKKDLISIKIKKQPFPSRIQNYLMPALISLFLFALFIFLATIFPVLSKLAINESYSVRTDFYNSLALPFTYCFLVLLFLSNYKTAFPSLKSVLKTILLLIISTYCAFLYISFYNGNFKDFSLFFLIFINTFNQIFKLIKKPCMDSSIQFLCHTGFLLLIAGVLTSTAAASSRQLKYPVKCYENKTTKTEYGDFTYKRIKSSKSREKNIYLLTCHYGKTMYQKKYKIKDKQLIPLNPDQLIIHSPIKDIFPEPLAVYSTNNKKQKLVTDFIMINIEIKTLIIIVWTGFLLMCFGLAVKLFTLISNKYKTADKEDTYAA